MFDVLFSKYSHKKEKPLDPSYKPSDAIVGRQFLNQHADKLAVVFPGWHTHGIWSDRLAGRLVKKGWAVLMYDFHDQILEPDENLVTESFRYARDKICDDLEKITSTHHYQRIQFVGGQFRGRGHGVGD